MKTFLSKKLFLYFLVILLVFSSLIGIGLLLTSSAEASVDTTPPAEITSLTSSSTDTTATLSWTDPTDSDFTSVKVYRDTSLLTTLSKSTQTFTDTGLSVGTTYIYKLTTVDTNGNESSGTSTIVTTSSLSDDLVPIMTSNTVPSPIVISSSSSYGTSYYPWSAFDDNITNTFGWYTPNGTSTGWLKIDFGDGNAKKVNHYTIRARNSSSHHEPRDWVLEASNDDLSWTPLHTVIDEPAYAQNENRYFYFDNATAYRYYRVNVSESNGTSNLSIGEMELKYGVTAPSPVVYDVAHTVTDDSVSLTWTNPSDPAFLKVRVYRDGVFVTETTDTSYTDTGLDGKTNYRYDFRTVTSEGITPERVSHDAKTTGTREIPYLTSATSNPPYVVSVSSNYDVPNYGAWAAFRVPDSTSKSWITSANVKTGWLQVDLGVYNKKVVNSYSVTTRNGDTRGDLKDWIFEASDDGINWVTLDTHSSEPAWGRNETRFYSFSNATPYRYYRLNVSDITINGSATYVSVNALDLNLTDESDTAAPGEVTSLSQTNTDTTVTLSWTNPTDPDFTLSKVYRDGVYVGDTSSNTFTDVGLVNDTSYNYVIKTLDSRGNLSSGSTIVANLVPELNESLPSPSAGWQRIDERDPAVKRTGSEWMYTVGSSYHASTVLLNDHKNSTYSLKFKGDRVRVITTVSTSSAPYYTNSVEVTLDGTDVTTHSEAFTATKHRVIVFERTGLEDKVHTIQIKNLVEKRMAADAIDISADGYVIDDYVAPSDVSSLVETRTPTSANLTWTDPSDLDFDSVRIYRNSVLIATIPKGVQAFTDAGLTSGTQYSYVVKTVDTSENESVGVSDSAVAEVKFTYKSEVADIISPDGLSSTISGTGYVIANVGRSSGKYYYEVRIDSGSVVLVGTSALPNANTTYRAYYSDSGNKYTNSTNAAYGATYAIGDVIGVAVDKDANTLEFFKNGISQGIAFTDLSTSATVYPYVTSGSSSGSRGFTANFGASDFAYTPPDGYLAWNVTKALDETAPAEITTLISTHTDTTATLTFTKPADPDFLKTKVYRDNVYVGETSTTSYNDSGLSGNTTYVYRLTTSDASGNESVGVTISVTTSSISADLVPTMTSNTTPSPVSISSSTIYPGYAAWNAFDDTNAPYTGWLTPDNVTSGWLQVDFGTSKSVNLYTVSGRNYSSHSEPKSWTFEGSNDALAWNTLHTVTNEPIWSTAEKRTYAFSNSSSYRYYRLNVSAAHGSWITVGEMELKKDWNPVVVPEVSNPTSSSTANSTTLSWTNPVDPNFSKVKVYRNGVYLKDVTGTTTTDSSLPDSTRFKYTLKTVSTTGLESEGVNIFASTTGTNIVPLMTAISAPYPYVASASTFYGGDYSPWKPFSGSLVSYFGWLTQYGNPTGWLKIDLGAYNEKVVSSYSITARNYTTRGDLKTWTFEGSNDNSNWVILDTRTDQSTWTAAEKRDFVFSNVTAYRYYRLNVSAIHPNADNFVSVGLLTFGVSDSVPPAEVTSLTPTVNETAVTLNWVAPSDVDFDHFKVYRDNVYLEDTVSPTYTDSNLASAVNYSYKVTTVDTYGNESVGVTVPATAEGTVKLTYKPHADDTLSADGLKITFSALGYAYSNSRKTSGKYYYEARLDSGSAALIGISNSPTTNTMARTYYSNSGDKYSNGTLSGIYGSSFVVGDVIGVAVDKDANTLEFFKNGVSQGVAFTDLSAFAEVYPYVASGSSSSTRTLSLNFGATPFAYAAPSGYLAWNNTTPVVETVPPAEVSSLTSYSDPTTVTLTWANPTDFDFSKVKVYRDDVFLAETTGTSYVDEGLTTGTSYVYKLTTVDSKGNESSGTSLTATAKQSVKFIYKSTADDIISIGGLTATLVGGGNVAANVGISSGKHYFEYKLDSGDQFMSGVGNSNSGYTAFRLYYAATGYKYHNGGNAAYASGYTSGSTIGIAVDKDANTIGYYVNGVFKGTAYTDLASIPIVYPVLNSGTSSGSRKITANFGATPFAYPIPSGYTSWEDSIPALDTDAPSEISELIDTRTNTSNTFRWKNPSQWDLAKVKVYRDDVYVGETTTNTFIDSNLTDETTYTYKLTTVDTRGNESVGTEITVSTGDPVVKLTYKNDVDTVDTLSADELMINFSEFGDAYSEYGVSSGKYYFEAKLTSGINAVFGISSSPTSRPKHRGYYSENGNKYKEGSNSTYASTFTTGSVIGVAVDKDTNTLTFYKNGASLGVAFADLSEIPTVYPLVYSGSGSSSRTVAVNFGAEQFAYSIPSGYQPWSASAVSVDTTAPAEVTSLTETHTDSTTTLSWENPSDSDFEKVKVYRDNVYVGESTSGAYTDSGLTSKTSYTYKVTSVDTNGNESSGTSMTVTTSAKLGDHLISPESGWKRFENANPSLTYIGSWVNDTYYGAHYSDKVGTNKLKFRFNGTKLRLYGIGNASYNSNIKVTIDGSTEYYDGRVGGTNITQSLQYEKLGLSSGVHTVEVDSNGVALWWYIDALDIDSDGELLSLDTTAPSEVTSLSETHTSSTVTLTWTNPSDSDFSKAKVYRDNVFVSEVLSPTSTFTESGLTPSTTYIYKVTSVDLNGNESTGTTTTTTTTDTTPPADVSALTASPAGTTATLNWVNPADSDFLEVIIFAGTTEIGRTSASTYVIGSLSSGTSYTFKVVSVDSVGNQSVGVTTTVTTTDTSPPTNITGLYGTPTESSIALSWTNPTDSDFDEVVIYRNSVEIGRTSAQTFTDIGLSSATPYSYKVTSVDTDGNESLGATLSISTYAIAAPPADVSDFASSSKTDTSISLTWSPSPSTTSYVVTRNGTEVYRGLSTSFTDSGLAPNTTYVYEIIAENGDGSSNPISTTVVTDPPVVVGEISGLSSIVGFSSIRFTWTNPSDPAFSHVNVYQDGSFVALATSNSVTISGLSQGIDYVFTFRTESNSGIESAGVSSSQRIEPTTSPVGTSARNIVFKTSTSQTKNKLAPTDLPQIYKDGSLANYLNQ